MKHEFLDDYSVFGRLALGEIENRGQEEALIRAIECRRGDEPNHHMPHYDLLEQFFLNRCGHLSNANPVYLDGGDAFNVMRYYPDDGSRAPWTIPELKIASLRFIQSGYGWTNEPVSLGAWFGDSFIVTVTPSYEKSVGFSVRMDIRLVDPKDWTYWKEDDEGTSREYKLPKYYEVAHKKARVRLPDVGNSMLSRFMRESDGWVGRKGKVIGPVLPGGDGAVL